MDNPTTLFDDIAELAEQYVLPGLTLDTVLKGRRKDVQALLAVDSIPQGGAQSLATKAK